MQDSFHQQYVSSRQGNYRGGQIIRQSWGWLSLTQTLKKLPETKKNKDLSKNTQKMFTRVTCSFAACVFFQSIFGFATWFWCPQNKRRRHSHVDRGLRGPSSFCRSTWITCLPLKLDHLLRFNEWDMRSCHWYHSSRQLWRRLFFWS